jgi:hypothetical protein
MSHAIFTTPSNKYGRRAVRDLGIFVRVPLEHSAPRKNENWMAIVLFVASSRLWRGTVNISNLDDGTLEHQGRL